MSDYQITYWDGYHGCHRKVTITARTEEAALTQFYFDYDVDVETIFDSIEKLPKKRLTAKSKSGTITA